MAELSLTEEQLVRQLRQGSQQAFGQIYIRYKDRLCNYCYWLIKDKDRAEDAVHESFLRVWTKIGTLNKLHSFRSWLFSIARYEALLFLRDRKPFEELSDDASVDNENPLDVLVSNEESNQIAGVLNTLRPAYRELIVLKVYEQLSYAEIATLTGLSLSAVRVHLHRARKALAKLYIQQYGENHDQ